jgi:hypothetical protein
VCSGSTKICATICNDSIVWLNSRYGLPTSFLLQQRIAVAGQFRQGRFGLDSGMDFAASMKAHREAVLRLFALLEDFAVQCEHAAVRLGGGAHGQYCHTCRCDGLGGSEIRLLPRRGVSVSRPFLKTWRSGGRGSPFVSWSAHERPAS